ncbi:MAG: NYN domain-containing protein [Patescibacteria group bacterium]
MFKYKNQRVGVFVDVSNMYHSAKNLYGARINFKEILKAVTDGRQLIRAIAYVIKSHSAEEEHFFDALIKSGFELKSKDLQIFMDGTKKADWDVGLAVDAITLADRLDSIILLSGDGDYVPLIEYLRVNKGCMVEVAAFGKTTSTKLIEAADDFLDLSSDKGKFLIIKK